MPYVQCVLHFSSYGNMAILLSLISHSIHYYLHWCMFVTYCSFSISFFFSFISSMLCFTLIVTLNCVPFALKSFTVIIKLLLYEFALNFIIWSSSLIMPPIEHMNTKHWTIIVYIIYVRSTWMCYAALSIYTVVYHKPTNEQLIFHFHGWCVSTKHKTCLNWSWKVTN